jgi:hypothetical protein
MEGLEWTLLEGDIRECAENYSGFSGRNRVRKYGVLREKLD